jgi:hypothetical protein
VRCGRQNARKGSGGSSRLCVQSRSPWAPFSVESDGTQVFWVSA